MHCGTGPAFVPAQKRKNSKEREGKERIEKLESTVTPLTNFLSTARELERTFSKLVVTIIST